MQADPQSRSAAITRRPRGKLTEPIYLCVGFALALLAGNYVAIIEPGLRTLACYVQGIGLGLLALALALLLVEMHRG